MIDHHLTLLLASVRVLLPGQKRGESELLTDVNTLFCEQKASFTRTP